MDTFLKKYLLFAILLIASILRLWRLNSIPPHLTPDEAALGYNSYSILKTGRDEYGEFLPLIFKSFGDYKPGLYIYFALPFIELFGLNEFSVRLPSAIFGILAVWLLYKIVYKFFDGENTQLSIINPHLLASISALMLTISPWHIQFSRGAWEANISLTLSLAGIYLFLKALKKPKQLIFSSVFFSTTLLTYQGAKLSTIVMVFVLLITFWKDFMRAVFVRNILIASFLLSFIIASPVFLSITSGKTGRLNVFSLFSYPRPKEYLQDFLSQGDEEVGSIIYYIFHSEALNFTRGILGRWFNHFSGRFLFFVGDWQNPRHSSPNHGVLLLIDLLLLPAGFVFLIKKRSKISIFVFLWLILAPLPSILSRDQVHAVRAFNMVIPLVIISSLGFSEIIILSKKIKETERKLLFFGFFVFLFLVSFVFYLDSYFVHLSKHNSHLWSYGYKQIVETITPIQNNYKEIKVQQSFAQPYIYFLFYQKYDPVEYQKQAKLVESEYKGDVGYIEKLDNILFSAIDWPQNRKENGTLVVADAIRIPDEELQKGFVNLIKEISYLNGDTAFRIVEVK